MWQKNAGNPIFGLFIDRKGRLTIHAYNDFSEYRLKNFIVYTDDEIIDKGVWLDFIIQVKPSTVNGGDIKNNGTIKIYRKKKTESCFNPIVSKGNMIIGKTRYPNGETIPLEERVFWPRLGYIPRK